MISTLGGLFKGPSLWEYFTVILDTIPKVLYFLYTCLASVLDILQTMVRKLAGLDVYYILQNGEYVPIRGQDPITEFIYGILGIGDRAPVYSVLSTTFWSLAIFGVIVLVIATMVAIVKAHYNEDSGKTSPITYVYTALKAVFTFAIVPLAVLLGITLSQFMLKTLDNITSGTGTTEEAVKYVYGDTSNKFLGGSMDEEGGSKAYGRFDYFGFGDYTNSATFSGSIFKAAAYSSNRIRMGQYGPGKFPNPKDIFGDTSAGSAKDFGDIANGDNWKEWVAYQVDYAFQNNLNVEGLIHAYECANTNNVLITIASVDMFGFIGVSDGFSKFNVGLVWYFYQLWQYNFLIGFATLIIAVGIMLGVILSLMSRLMKTVALFIIYPSILGLAPLDNFKAFGTWRTEFISQILMAFGAIIGMNLFFLIMPYISNLSFFGVSILDYIINILVIITGLLMVQGFISFLSGLIGGADASKTGDDLKKGTAGLLAKAGSATLATANIAGRAAVGLNPMLLGAKIGGTAIQQSGLRSKMDQIAQYEGRGGAGSAVGKKLKEIKKGNKESAQSRHASEQENYNGKAVYIKKAVDAGTFETDKKGNSRSKEVQETLAGNAYEKYVKGLGKGKDSKADRATGEGSTARQMRIDNFMDEKSGKTKVGDIAKKQASGLLTAFAKGIENAVGNVNINTKAISGVFTNLSNGKFDKDSGAQTGGTYSAPGGNIFKEMFTFSNPVKSLEKAVKPEEAQKKAADASVEAANAIKGATAELKNVAEAVAEALKRATTPPSSTK